MRIETYDTTGELANLEVERSLTGNEEAQTVLGLINNAMKQASAGILELERFEEDEFVSSSKLKDLADKVTINNKVILAECEALMATAQVASSILTGMEKEALEACSNASQAIRVLRAYHEALSSTGRSIIVLPEHLTGTFSVIGKAISSEISSASDARAKVAEVKTNGYEGNFLEIVRGTTLRKALNPSEYSFIDGQGIHARTQAITDGTEDTMFEVEAYNVSTSMQSNTGGRDVMPDTLARVQKAVRNDDMLTMVDVPWSQFNSPDGLYADITMETELGTLSSVSIKVAERVDATGMSIPLPSVERVDISLDGNEWINTPCPYDAIIAASGGEITIHVNSGSARYLRIRLRQSSMYQTNILNAAHWYIPVSGEGHWLTGDSEPVYKIGLAQKADWFKPVLIRDTGGNFIERRVFSIPANRYAIAIREIKAEVYRYSANTVAESQTYKMPAPVGSIMLRATEVVPEGTGISYEISPDEGGTWVPITPMERSGQGAEVVVFAIGGYSNPNQNSARYVQVTKYPTTIKVRAKLTATESKAPSITKLSIEPTFYEE